MSNESEVVLGASESLDQSNRTYRLHVHSIVKTDSFGMGFHLTSSSISCDCEPREIFDTLIRAHGRAFDTNVVDTAALPSDLVISNRIQTHLMRAD